MTSGRINPTVRTVFHQLVTQTRALAQGVPVPGATASLEPLTASTAMAEIQARLAGA
ncbi:hypothetical protein [Hymenobacter baengnokdamensis]|uniref:hypothetical protein n=1 Tax=Hymenobacter baengnokdamensis TaxID=2615203 RepID=UPI00177BA1F6|nr:hypothetical protein [Hymenobacter baengnokdamensis]